MPEQIDELRIQIHQVVAVVLRRETNQVGNRARRIVQNRVQKTVIYGDVSAPGGFQ